MSEFLTQLFVDSRARVSGTPTDFTLDLAENLACGSDTVVHVAAVSHPCTWWTVEPNVRDKLYLQLFAPDEGRTVSAILTLQPGFHDGHSFAAALQEELTGVTELYAGWPAWHVQYIPSENRIGVQWGDETDLMQRSWAFLSATDLRSPTLNWITGTGGLNTVAGPFFDPNSPQLCDNVLHLEGTTFTVSNYTIWISGYYDALAGIHELYLHSDLSQFRSAGPRLKEDRDVICRIPVESDHGYLNHYRSYGHQFDFTPCYNATQKTLRFSLTDHMGRTVDLHGGEVSIELRFFGYPSLL